MLGYQLTCNEQNGHLISATVTGTSASLHNFHNNTHYTCEVCAFTSVGCGPPAVTHISTYGECKYITVIIYNFHVYFAALVGPPHSLLANATATAVYLSWMAPLDPEVVITGYAVVYQLISTPLSLATPRPKVVVTGINGTSYIFESLLATSTYRIAVIAVYEGGSGPESNDLYVTTESPGTIYTHISICINYNFIQVIIHHMN